MNILKIIALCVSLLAYSSADFLDPFYNYGYPQYYQPRPQPSLTKRFFDFTAPEKTDIYHLNLPHQPYSVKRAKASTTPSPTAPEQTDIYHLNLPHQPYPVKRIKVPTTPDPDAPIDRNIYDGKK